jgi:hypothetical protein
MVVGDAKVPLFPASSRIVTLLLPLFATTARPSREITETPSGLDPTGIVGSVKMGIPVIRFNIDTVLSEKLVTTA